MNMVLIWYKHGTDTVQTWSTDTVQTWSTDTVQTWY